MTPKRVIPRALANSDIEAAVDYYRSEAGERIALGFIQSLEQAFRHIARHPASGSNRYAHELNLRSLKVWPLKRYPYLVFYIDGDDAVDVWRVLHAERDIPTWMSQPEDP